MSSSNTYLSYLEQSGGGFPIFQGRLLRRPQRGFGLFSSLARFVIPIGKSLIKRIAPKVISTVTEGVGDVVSGKKSVKSALKSTGKNILKKSAEAVKEEILGQRGGQLMLKRRGTDTLITSKKKRKVVKNQKSKLIPQSVLGNILV